jgi:hypothetical protein
MAAVAEPASWNDEAVRADGGRGEAGLEIGIRRA